MTAFRKHAGLFQSGVIWFLALVALLPFVQIVWIAQKPRSHVDASWYYLSQKMPAREVEQKIEIDARPLRVALRNSVIVSTTCALLGICLSLFAGYAFAKKSFPGKGFLFDLVVVSMALPPAMLMMPLFRISIMLRLYDTFAALILPAAVTGFGIFYMRLILSSVPDSIIHSARLDGLSETKLLLRIVVPMIWPAILTLGVMQFIITWNSFIIPHTLIASPSNYTASVLLGRLLSDYRGLMWNDIMIVVAAAIVPVAIIFAACNRVLIRNLADVDSSDA